MQTSSRVRAQFLRDAVSYVGNRTPFEILPLAIATLILLAVPIARATAASGETEPTTSTGAALPVAQEASFRPEIGGRLSDRSASGRDGIHVRGLVRNAGSGSAKVLFAARRAGTKNWFKVATKQVKSGKKFTLTWKGKRPGRYLTKITVSKRGKSASDHLGAAFVFRIGHASYYGPGLYGGGLACGGSLKRSTVGVAHKTLPCGTQVTFKLGSRIVTAPVIDRGPFIAGRDWDLTTALKEKLHFGSTGPVHATG